MRLLLDECTPRRLRRDLRGHEVLTVEDAGVKGLKNGALLRAASGRFDVLVTVDKGLAHQQNIKLFDIGLLILVAKNNTYQTLRRLAPEALRAPEEIRPGEVVRVGVAPGGDAP